MSYRAGFSLVCATVGVGLLAGPGWALLAAAALVWLAGPVDARVLAALRRAKAAAQATRRGLARAPRHATAAGCIVGAVLAAPAGAWLLGGAGVALVTGAAMMGAVGLLAGWET